MRPHSSVRSRVPVLALALAAALPLAAAAAEDPGQRLRIEGTDGDRRRVVLDAMKGELARSMKELRLDGYEAPYFVSYQLKDQTSVELTARYGALFGDESKRSAKLSVDVRVGSYDADSSEESSSPFPFGLEDGPSYLPDLDAPVDFDPAALKNALWLATDAKYKAALSSWLRKKGKGVYAVADEEKAAAFSREAPVRFVQEPLPFEFDRAAWKERALALSKLFRDHPELFDSEVRITGDHTVRVQTNSEGTELVTEEAIFGVHVQAVTRADDGQLLENSRDWYAATAGELPPLDRMVAESKDMIAELVALRTAPVIDPYTGPAILAPEATGVLFHEAVGHRLEGERLDDDNEGRTFKGQVGVRVLPAFLSVIEDPTVRAREGRTLNGYYRFDDEGVASERTPLIQDGVLRSYILSRRPVKGFPRSNGHGRAQGNRAPMARMANLFVDSTRQVPEKKLKEMLIDEAKKAGKPYGLLIRDMTGGNTNTSSYGYQAFKGMPRLVYRIDVKTGKEQLIRGVELVGTPLTTINKIVATGDRFGVFNGFCGAESGYVPVSTVAPAALIREIELQRTAKITERLPLLPGPWSAPRSEREP
jgi:predicted Zn-dependent protease